MADSEMNRVAIVVEELQALDKQIQKLLSRRRYLRDLKTRLLDKPHQTTKRRNINPTSCAQVQGQVSFAPAPRRNNADEDLDGFQLCRRGFKARTPPAAQASIQIQNRFDPLRVPSLPSTPGDIIVEMVFLEPHSRAERTPLKISTSLLVSGEINQDMDSLTTPTKGKESLVCEPWTPTANLKMLISAASPEIRNREMELGADDREVTGSIDVCQENLMEDDPDKLQPSRKEKSLGLLCHKFLARYPDYPNPALNNNICLDEVAGELSVERRRIYDIVNVLESLHMVSRLAKNRYTWHGRCNLIQTLAALKKVGEEHQYAEQMQQIKQKDFEKEFESDNEEKENKVFLKTKPTERDFGHKEMCFVELPGMEFKAASVNGRKDKSLRVMSQKFVMLFLVSTPRIVSLEVAAKILIGEDQVVDLDKSKFKNSNPLIATTSVNPTPLNSRSSIENCTKNLFPDSNAKQSFTRHPSLIKLAKSIDDDRRKINSAPSTPLKKTCNCSSENSTGQIPFVCKSQLEEYTKSDKQKLDEQNVEHQLQTKGNNGIGIVKPVLTSELSGTIASPTDSFQLKTALPIAQSSLIPMLLPQSHNNGPYAIYFHAPSVRPMANPSSLAVRSMTFGENLSNSESPSRRCSGNMTSASPANEKDINTEGANLFQNIGTPDKNLKRVLAEKSPEESSPKQAKVQIQTSAAYRTLIPTGYLIPLTSQSVLGCSGDLDPERKAEHNSVVHPGAFSSPTTGMASVSPDCARFTSPTGAALSKVSVSSFPRMNQSSPSMASNHHLNSPSPAILNFTLQNLGLISPGIQAPVEHVSPIPNHFGFQQGGMIFVKPVSPVPIQHQISAQPVTLLSLQQGSASGFKAALSRTIRNAAAPGGLARRDGTGRDAKAAESFKGLHHNLAFFSDYYKPPCLTHTVTFSTAPSIPDFLALGLFHSSSDSTACAVTRHSE
ncbi:E2F8 factor, partial [Polypterus senegalus]